MLLRSIPAPPATRRLFFTIVVACRRRLAKRWEQTPLAKLFTLEDEWSMLKQRAQAVRVRQAINARGLLLHDAFLLFNESRNGLISLAEMYGAFEWLQVPRSIVSVAGPRTRRSMSSLSSAHLGLYVEGTQFGYLPVVWPR